MTDISTVAALAVSTSTLKKLVFSKPVADGALKLSVRLVEHRGRRMLACEYSLVGDTVSQKNLPGDAIAALIEEEKQAFAQINLITTAGDAEYKRTKKGEVLLGTDKLYKRLSGGTQSFENAVGALMNEKRRILKGDEAFLISLGISDAAGRVHDKRQAKFRQINKFLEYLEDVYERLPREGRLNVYDLCCGKSYLSFAVYHYLTAIRHREVYMLGIDLKRDVIAFCAERASELGYSGMHFVCDDITNTPPSIKPDLVISLHACDVATDIVLDTAVRLGAGVILSTPCCQRELSRLISYPELAFVTRYPKLKRALCDTLTDALRLERLSALGYEVSATELVDPEDTPKNTLIIATRRGGKNARAAAEYNALVSRITGEGKDYIGLIKNEEDL